jgi:ASC-1-like (ASCH) protein
MGRNFNIKVYNSYKKIMKKKSLGNYQPSKEKISNAFVIKNYLLKSAKENPKDATTLYALGKWCFAISAIPYVTIIPF